MRVTRRRQSSGSKPLDCSGSVWATTKKVDPSSIDEAWRAEISTRGAAVNWYHDGATGQELLDATRQVRRDIAACARLGHRFRVGAMSHGFDDDASQDFTMRWSTSSPTTRS